MTPYSFLVLFPAVHLPHQNVSVSLEKKRKDVPSRTRRANQAALRADGLFLMANLNSSILNIDLRKQIRELFVL